MNMPITGPVLKTKARENAQTFDVENFQGNNGCLESFPTQHDKTRDEETQHSLYYCLVNWQEKLHSDRKTYKGGKRPQERLRFLFCCSAIGENLKPLVISKAARLRALKEEGIGTRHLPVGWFSDKKYG
jgi:hypothetical protein